MDQNVKMKVKNMKLSEIKKAEYNPRIISPEAYKGLKRSLEEFGLVQPIVYNEKTGNIVGGHQRFDAMLDQGVEKSDVIIVDLDEIQEKALNLSLNNPAIAGDFTTQAWQLLEDVEIELGQEYLEDLKLDTLGDFLPELSFEGENGSGENNSDYEQPFLEAEIITKAFEYYRETGFPYRKLPIQICMQEINKLSRVEPENQANSIVGYHVADTYHPHRFHVSVDGKHTPFDSFHDDKKLMRSIKLAYDEGASLKGLLGPMSLVLGTQACSNFRPAFAMSLYREFCKKDAIVLDTSTGYGGRLVGAMASGVVKKYVGVDPNTKTHQGNLNMINDLGWKHKVELHNVPVEEFQYNKTAHFDFAFTSPPYFTKEHYSEEETQSFNRYKTATEWREGFLIPMLTCQHELLKSGAFNVVNIADVKIKGKLFECEGWCVEDAVSVGFELVERREFGLTSRFGANQDEDKATEAVLIFRKK